MFVPIHCLERVPRPQWNQGKSLEVFTGLKRPAWVTEPKAAWVVGNSTGGERVAQRERSKGSAEGTP